MVSIVYSSLTEVKNQYTTNENRIHISPKIESVLMNIYAIKYSWLTKNKNIIYTFVFVNVCRKNIFDIYVTEYGTALTAILPLLFLYLNTVTVTAGTFEP